MRSHNLNSNHQLAVIQVSRVGILRIAHSGGVVKLTVRDRAQAVR
ncbi:hypothetical protein NIES2104_54520 [Leptolyngbya sp. NIES-2104]|nr:hypothetical protein NIES2104_54520 [Leptolyngbya sp. NIES-2104]